MTKWYILPGMGASSEMYDSLRRNLSFEVNFLNWPKYQKEVTYKEVAERLISENQISSNDIIGGSSLGGMIALEIAMILNAKAVVLMGSALHKKEIKRLISLLSPLASITPLSFIQTLSGRIDDVVSQMFSESDPDFIRSMSRYVSSWPGYRGAADNVFRLHGKKDHIITCPKSDCEVIKDAGHLLAITHPGECSDFFEKTNKFLNKSLSRELINCGD
ncbi:MAG: alpha/beta hydrolase [Pseudomonadota bacterium]